MSETLSETLPSQTIGNDSLDSLFKNLHLSNDQSSSLIEKIYDSIRRLNNDDEQAEHFVEFFRQNEHLKLNININETLKNGDTLLCLCCNKGSLNFVKTLIENCNANINQSRSINCGNTNNSTSSSSSSSFSTTTPTITISARRQSRLMGGSIKHNSNSQKGDSPLSVCIKYGHDALAEYLIERGADICGGDLVVDQQPKSLDFERSPVQEAIRLNRAKVVEKMFETMFQRDDVPTIEWMLSKRYDILRQVLVSENLETLRVILPNIIENRRIDGEILIHILNYLLMKSKIQERKEKVNQILETVMNVATTDDSSRTQFEIYNLDIFIRGFFATLKALFNTVSSDDSRASILTYRTSLFFFIIKYQKSMLNFQAYYADIDSAFDYFYTKMKETGENVVKLVEYFITFYDTLISMNHIHLTSGNVKYLLRLEHIKKLDILGDYLIQRSLIPMDLKELARIKIKDTMHTYNFYSVNNLPILDQHCKEFLYYMI
jgi:hypothetical protein